MKASQFLDSEKAALLEIKSLLTEGENSQFRTSGKRLDEQLENLIKPREYLYLHFPDGYEYSSSTAFLKRVRAELDYFLKII